MEYFKLVLLGRMALMKALLTEESRRGEALRLCVCVMEALEIIMDKASLAALGKDDYTI